MAKLPIDLSHFKKVHSDKDSTTLSHPQGHSIKLAHKLLSPKMRSQLAALPMAEGGNPKLEESKKEPSSRPSFVPLSDEPRESTADKDPDNDKKAHRSLNFNNYDGGGNVSSDDTKSIGQRTGFPDSAPSPTTTPKAPACSECGYTSTPIKKYADGGQPSVEDMEAIDQPGQKDQMFRSIGNAAQNQVEKANQQDRAMWQAASQGDYSKLADNSAGMAMGTIGPAEGAIEEAAGGLRQAAEKAVGAAPTSVAGFTDKPKEIQQLLTQVGDAMDQGHVNMDDLRAVVSRQNSIAGQKTPTEALRATQASRRAAMAKPKMASGGKIQHYADGTPDGGASNGQQPDSLDSIKNDLAQRVVADSGAAPIRTESSLPMQQSPSPQSMPVGNQSSEIANIYNNLLSYRFQNTGALADKYKINPDGSANEILPDLLKRAYETHQSASKQADAVGHGRYLDELQQNKARGAAGLPMIPVQPDPYAPPAPSGPALTSGASPDQTQPPSNMRPASGDNSASQEQMPTMLGGYQMEAKGIRNEAAAQQVIEDQNAKRYENEAIANQNAQSQFAQHMADNNDLVDHVIKSLNDPSSKVDPNRYFHSMNTGQKLLTGIGLLLGGLGNRGNAASDFIDQQINRDIAAQQADLGTKKSLLSAAMDHYKDFDQALLFTQMASKGVASAWVQQIAAKNANPVIAARAQQFVGRLQQKVGPMSQMLGAMQLANPNGNAGAGPRGLGPVEANINHSIQVLQAMGTMGNAGAGKQAEDLRSRVLPGIGLSDQPIPQETRDKITARNTLEARAQDLYNWAKQHSGLTPTSPANIALINQGRVKAAELQGLYRQGTNGGVYKTGEQKFIESIVPDDVNKFMNQIRVLPQIQEVINSNRSQKDMLYKSIGLHPFEGTPQAQQQGASKIRFNPAGK